MNDRLGTVVEDGGEAAGANVTGFFRLTDTGVEVRYADGRGEMLTATPDGGVLDEAFRRERRYELPQLVPGRPCLQRYGQEIGGGGICQPAGPGPCAQGKLRGLSRAHGSSATAPRFIPPKPSRMTKAVHAKPTSFVIPSITPSAGPAKLAALMPVTVKDSVVHSIDEGADAAAAPPVVTTALAPSQASILPPGQHDASTCLKVESDGNHWGFRNSCGYSVQFSYCMWRGSEPLAACDDGHSISGSVAANSIATLTSDTQLWRQGR